MSPKNTSSSKHDEKEKNRTSIYVALIGLIGAIIIAVVSMINARTQVLLPVSLTQNAQYTSTPLILKDTAKVRNISETTEIASSTVIPINNCSGSNAIQQEISQTYIHTITENGIEFPVMQWKRIFPAIEQHYSIPENHVETYSITLRECLNHGLMKSLT